MNLKLHKKRKLNQCTTEILGESGKVRIALLILYIQSKSKNNNNLIYVRLLKSIRHIEICDFIYM